MSAPKLSRETQALQKALATEYALAYCKQNKLSSQKLSRQRFDIVANHAIFSQPSGVKPNGLLNDMETMPFPTLIITFDGGKLSVETTEHTERYLK